VAVAELNVVLVVAMFATFIVLLTTGFPVAFVLAGTGTLFALLGAVLNAYGVRVDADLSFLGLVVNRTFAGISSFGLIPIPMFIFMGHMLDRSGVAQELMRAMQIVLGRLPGGLALSVTVIGVILAASTGIVGASVVLLATMALPTMLNQGYAPTLATGVVSAAGTLGILIPPSVMLVLMGDQLNLSVGDLFMGAVVPGLILAALYFAYVAIYSAMRPQHAPPLPRSERGGLGALALTVLIARALVAPLFLILAVLGSMFAGIASPTEASGVGAAGATLLAALNRKLTWRNLRDVSRATGRTTAFIFGIILGATCFAVVLRGLGGDEVIEGGFRALALGPHGTLIFVLALVFVLGFFIDWVEISIILLPLVAPVLNAFGFDPIWWVLLVAVCLQTSFLTPPMGPSLFYLQGVAPPEITTGILYRGIIPFVILQLIGLLACTLWPGTVLWLPRAVFG
jgi:tripartite ATP-independent transporter DctM subunit